MSEERPMKKHKGIIVIGILAVILLVATAGIFVYKKRSGKDETCIVTQYSDATGKQANCYTITKDGHLIIIDGGWAENAPALRQIIAENGNHVDAWFISHTHSDHVGAFNVIYADPQGITIDTVYDSGFDYDFIREAGEPYDSMGLEPANTYDALTKNAENVVHLKRDDEFEVCGLKIRVFNAFDDIVKQNVGEQFDYQNNGSLCMKFTNIDESFLFTGDIKLDMNTYLFDTYGEAMSGDYVQLSHHGNWGLNTEYYDQMNAKAYFADIPSEFYETHPIGELRQHLLENGKTYYDYSMAPNSVELK